MPRRLQVWNGSELALQKSDGIAHLSRLKHDEVSQIRRFFLTRDGGLRKTRESVRNCANSYESVLKKLAMAVEFDHMYIGCADSKTSVGNEIQVKQLKDMMLLNLEIIQQQTEQILAKDKIIKALTDENKNVS